MEPAGQAHLLAPPGPGPFPEAELLAGPSGERFGIYVHCPYCRTKCPYCDFNVAIHREDRIAPFVAGLRAELGRYAGLPWAGRVPAESLFLGGGTPSLLPPEAVAAVLADARQGLGLGPDAEVTLEANPEGLDVDRLRAFRAAGVTRLSLGVQALDDALLRRLGRTHSAADAEAAYRAARAAGFEDVSVDLLYGCPGQDLAAWVGTLDQALAWGPDHLSAYALTLEPATPFGRRPPPGLPEEDLQVAFFEVLVERATRAGLARYEISNFARPGRRSRHNLGYWRREEYIGLGPGAHGALGAVRYWTQRSEPRWRAGALAGRWVINGWERLSERQVAAERIVLGLRLAEGIPVQWLERHLAGVPDGPGAVLARYEAAGIATVRDGRLALTDRGVLVSDAIFAELV
ncbi:MAG TPA: radical SAM family heme chaperone HemW [Methylomirabilota bacterium]|nr:radical SAM family heme chaperone HemW [Methylomirabilota bacterium]